MAGCICDGLSIGMQQTVCGSLNQHGLAMSSTPRNLGVKGLAEEGLHAPGNLNNGYGFVDIPMLTKVVSGFSKSFASQ